MKKSDDTFLARWLNGELTPEEASNFEKSEDFYVYKKIIEETDNRKAPDFNEEGLFSKISKETIAKPKVRKLNVAYLYMAAAVLLVLFGLFYFQNLGKISYHTDYGEQLQVILPDSSIVTINANSTLEFNKSDWINNRKLLLEGEAYFEVKKGAQFKVETKEGTVQVLGTKFNVNTSEGYFEVKCYSGKVKVSNITIENSILTKGMATQIIKNSQNNWKFDTDHTFWVKGVTTFKETPFSKVILSLENQFGVTIQNQNNYADERFTGSFKNTSLEEALKTVFEAMGIEYTIMDKKHILIK